MLNVFPRIFSPLVSANVLIFILLVEIPILIGGYSYYDGDDINEFIKVCKGCKSCSSGGCTPECLELLREDPNKDYDINSNACSEENVQELKISQATVRKFQSKLNSYFQSIVLWALFVPSLCIGVYLIAVGHFDWRTLPIIGSKYHPDPTTGIPYWQYHRMKYVVAKTEVSKRHGVQGKPSANSFVVDDVSSVGSRSSASEGAESEHESHEDHFPNEPSRMDIHSVK